MVIYVSINAPFRTMPMAKCSLKIVQINQCLSARAISDRQLNAGAARGRGRSVTSGMAINQRLKPHLVAAGPPAYADERVCRCWRRATSPLRRVIASTPSACAVYMNKPSCRGWRLNANITAACSCLRLAAN